MGTEILIIFTLVPITLWVFDLARIIQRRKVVEHAILLVAGFLALGCMSLSSFLGGWSPMQGVVVGSVFYGPVYVASWFIVSAIFKVKRGHGKSGDIT
jgi:hypothetical protein